MPTTLLLKRARLTNVRGFKDVDIDFLTSDGKPRPMTLVIGRNGSGKSTLLRALAIGLCQQDEASNLKGKMAGDFLRIGKKREEVKVATIQIELMDPDSPESKYLLTTNVTRDGDGQEILEKHAESPNGFPWDAIFVAGYGVNRGPKGLSESPPSVYQRSDAVETLFDGDAFLIDPPTALKFLKLAAGESEKRKKFFKQTENSLKSLLELQPSYKIDISSKEVTVHGPWGNLPFHALGDGYRGTAGWFLDFSYRSFLANREAELAGIVLIDEIDEHLHPSWQKNLVPLLKKRFPRVQFIGTTHSAMSIVNCDRGELLLSDLHNTVAFVHGVDGPQGKTIDAVLRGEWFGLSSTLDSESEKLLKEYEKAVANREGEEEVARLRGKLRDRLGRLIDSPIDELAIEIANEVRKDFQKASPEQRQERLVAAAQLLRERLREKGYRG